MQYTELKVVTIVDDVKQFEDEVNGLCCNQGYFIISCKVNTVAEYFSHRTEFLYTAFLGK